MESKGDESIERSSTDLTTIAHNKRGSQRDTIGIHLELSTPPGVSLESGGFR